MARVLCLHGLGGTGATMWPIVGHLEAANHTVLAPTLPGHGGVPEDLHGVGWHDWLEAACAWEADVVAGQSLGAALALALAAQGRCRAAVVINALAPDPDALDGLEWRRSRGTEWIEVGPSTLGEIAYERLPIGALIEMHEGLASLSLAEVAVPLLVVSGALDDAVDPACSDVIASSVSGPVERLVLRRTGHVASLDVERDLLGREIARFSAAAGRQPG